MPSLRAATLAVLAAAVVALPAVAVASYTAGGSGSARVGARSIANASGLAAACMATRGVDDTSLTWTASPDAPLVSYVITRTGGAGPATLTAPAGATSLTDTTTGWAGATGGYQYSYTIRAVVGTQPWTTAASAAVTRTFSKAGKCLGA
jgi:hypothetical protein